MPTTAPVIAPLISRNIAGVILAIAMPGIACHGYYAVEALGAVSVFWRGVVIAAYPAALIGLAWCLLTLSSARRSNGGLWTAGLALAIPVCILLVARAHFG